MKVLDIGTVSAQFRHSLGTVSGSPASSTKAAGQILEYAQPRTAQ